MNDKKNTKPRCPDCGGKFKRSANFCTACGAVKGTMGKSFYSNPDPAEREAAWSHGYNAGVITKVGRY